MIIEHSKKYDKANSCHMIPFENRGTLWSFTEETKCVGRKKFEQINE